MSHNPDKMRSGITILRVQRLDEKTNEWVDVITGQRESIGNALSTNKGCGKKMDALGYVICGEFADLKNGGEQWLCDECRESSKECNCGGIKGKDWSHEKWCNLSTNSVIKISGGNPEPFDISHFDSIAKDKKSVTEEK